MENKVDFESFESFRHGLVVSKIWLCDELEGILDKNQKYNLNILASWTNLITFMLFIRNRTLYTEAHAYDFKQSATDIAKLINDAWMYEDPKIHYHVDDINNINFNDKPDYSIFINTSIEHLESRQWFNSIPKNSIVVIQSSNIQDAESPWFIKDPVYSLDALIARYPMNLIYTGTKPIRYNHFGYDRYMIIGYK